METKYWIITDYPQIKTSEYLDEIRTLITKEKFYCYISNEELDKLCPSPKEKEYSKFLANIEPDTEHLNKSYDDFSKENNKKWMTLRQGLILWLSVYKINGQFLDVKGLTRFHSLDADGNAMSMYRSNDGRFNIDRNNRDYRNGDNGPREVSDLFKNELTLENINERLTKLEKLA